MCSAKSQESLELSQLLPGVVASVQQIAAEEEQQIRQINELKEVEMGKVRDFREEQLNQLRGKLNKAAKGLREEKNELVSDAETALVYHFGDRLAGHPDWSEKFLSLEERIKTEAQGHNVIPVLLRHPVVYQDDWLDSGRVEVTDCLVLVPAEFSDSTKGKSELFTASFEKSLTHGHAFTHSQIPVNRSALSLRGMFARIPEGILRGDGGFTGNNLELSSYCLRTDGGPSYSMSEYAYSDSQSCVLFETSENDLDNLMEHYSFHVGWKEIGLFIKRNATESDLERTVTNLYDTLEQLEFTDFKGIRNPLVTAFRKIQSSRRQTASLRKSLKAGLSSL